MAIVRALTQNILELQPGNVRIEPGLSTVIKDDDLDNMMKANPYIVTAMDHGLISVEYETLKPPNNSNKPPIKP